MKLFEAEICKNLIEKLCNFHYVNYSIARKLSVFKNRIIDEAKFCFDEEMKLVNKYVKRDENNKPILENNNIVFNSVEDKEIFEKELAELRNTEIDNLEKLPLKFSDIKESDETLTPNEIDILSHIIDWDD